jgi:hypothetical protein
MSAMCLFVFHGLVLCACVIYPLLMANFTCLGLKFYQDSLVCNVHSCVNSVSYEIKLIMSSSYR